MGWLSEQSGYTNIGQALARGEIELFLVPSAAIAGTSSRRGTITLKVQGRIWNLIFEDYPPVQEPVTERLIAPSTAADYAQIGLATSRSAAEFWANVELWTDRSMLRSWRCRTQRSPRLAHRNAVVRAPGRFPAR
jgi:hypothetical protein